MAEDAHAAFCFETLAAELKDREALTLPQVQELWTLYHTSAQAGAVTSSAATPAGQPDIEHGNHDKASIDAAGNNDKELNEALVPQGKDERSETSRPNLQIPSITRLQASSPASGTSSSSASTSSSRAALGPSSNSSSRSSFFSLGRSKQPSPATTKTEQYPLFVTWNTVSARSRHRTLRGCIGTFDPKELTEGLAEYSLVAAFKDTRFHPISASELPSLSCNVTLLTNFTTCSSPFDWEIGKHGIRISFSSGHKRFGATYLPDVALDQGWTKEGTLVSLMRKAGWSGRSRDWRDAFENGKGGVVRYEGEKVTLDWEEWAPWREWVREETQR